MNNRDHDNPQSIGDWFFKQHKEQFDGSGKRSDFLGKICVPVPNTATEKENKKIDRLVYDIMA